MKSKDSLPDKLEKWLYKEMDRIDKEIDEGGAFYDLQAEKNAYEAVLEKMWEIRQ